MKKNLFLLVCFVLFSSSSLLAANAPITFAPVIIMTGPGSFSMPIIVNNFTNIGGLSLYLEYDAAIITYQNTFTANPALAGFGVGNIPSTGTKKYIIFQWYNFPGVSLPNGSAICTANFTYSTVNGTSCALSWYFSAPPGVTGGSCEYTDGNTNHLNDVPWADYYKNGSVSPPLVANFSAGNLTPPKNTTVQFTDQSTGGATSWDWSFDRPTVSYLNSTNSHSQNPQVQFTDGGLYTVTLVVHNSYLTASEIKTGYIRAGISGVWTGTTSSDWSTLSNWDNYLLPVGSTDVVIPPTASFWPVFTGDLILGNNCHNLTLSGATSKMTITGNLTIP